MTAVSVRPKTTEIVRFDKSKVVQDLASDKSGEHSFNVVENACIQQDCTLKNCSSYVMK